MNIWTKAGISVLLMAVLAELIRGKTVLKIYKLSGEVMQRVEVPGLDLRLPDVGIYPFGSELTLDLRFFTSNQKLFCGLDGRGAAGLTNETLVFVDQLIECFKPKRYSHKPAAEFVETKLSVKQANFFVIAKNDKDSIEAKVEEIEQSVQEGGKFSAVFNITIMVLDPQSYEFLRNEAELQAERKNPIKAKIDFRIVPVSHAAGLSAPAQPQRNSHLDGHNRPRTLQGALHAAENRSRQRPGGRPQQHQVHPQALLQRAP